jgi:NADH-quinone oxidoreductase subunit E
MLSEIEKREIAAHRGHYADVRAVVPEALKIVQGHRGWISDEALKDIADHLALAPDEVDSIATFYTIIFRRPVGRHVILLCDSVSCHLTGYDAVREHLASRLGIGLGQTTADGRFTLLPAACLGLCEQAPAMMIGEDVHGNLTPHKVDEVLARYD